MRPNVSTEWLDVGASQEGVFVRDYGRLEQVTLDLAQRSQQTPLLTLFLGSHTKEIALQYLFPSNNIRRTRAKSAIGLRYDLLSANNPEPILIADGEPGKAPVDLDQDAYLRKASDYPITWGPATASAALGFLYARLVLLFTDIVCIFADDFPSLASIADFLVSCVKAGSASSLPKTVRPRIVVLVAGDPCDPASTASEAKEFYRKLHTPGADRLRSCFASVNLASFDPRLPAVSQYERLRTYLKDQLNQIKATRLDNWSLFSAAHLCAYFQAAVKHTAGSIEQTFDFVQATREHNPVPRGLDRRISHYLDIGLQNNCSLQVLLASLISALLMDHYVPGMASLKPRTVFRKLYRPAVIGGLSNHNRGTTKQTKEDLIIMAEFEFKSQYHCLKTSGLSAVESRRNYLMKRSDTLGRIQSNKICLFCLLFGMPASNLEYQFTIAFCPLCLSQSPLTINILPPTMNPSILAIDGGGVRGGIPLEFLLLIQEHLGPKCGVADVIDLTVGPSAGKGSFLEIIPKWISWIMSDSCYDAAIFDATLQEVFGRTRRAFQPLGQGSPLHSYSKSKFAAIATSIGKDTKSFVFGNFNPVEWLDKEDDYILYRSAQMHQEPLLWEVARATTAAPFYFSVANVQDIGSFQDGGLQDNFAADIARRLSRRLWPSKTGISKLISLGTGAEEIPRDQTPRFRNIFRDGFLRRGYDAFMSHLEGRPRWLKLRDELDASARSDYMRLDVSLKNLPSTLDSAEMISDYRNLVISQLGSARSARDVAIALLVARFYFTLDRIPDRIPGSTFSWCHGVIKCKGNTFEIIEAIQHLYPDDLEFATDKGHLTSFSLGGICKACGRYSQPVSILIHHPDQVINIYLRIDKHRKWSISGFPNRISWHIEVQHLQSGFGRPDHGYPSILPCASCSNETRVSWRKEHSLSRSGEAEQRNKKPRL
ncbi:patatin-like phospholipase family protein [Aspergillus saccharolyticus JOP 1030-1]|uniref:Patatin-like phospholipase n=1 Tax=Aspergillus saccharolyticus JOP 1030-1 TaxID=1450539 RepID=A0A318Z8B7_9EURO|nr:patatin-like phospholipase [Aspergillus saccharolyticus JOP 1030-1]PYH40993.1 patatin-like phospholipase [Aspergillus saccharolyticus JOP 1030-1]